MQKHTKIYLKGMGYTDTDFVESELSGKRAVDIHHIISRGKGGEDRIENLMALTREEHNTFGDKYKYMKLLFIKHEEMMLKRGVEYDKQWIKEQYNKYEN